MSVEIPWDFQGKLHFIINSIHHSFSIFYTVVYRHICMYKCRTKYLFVVMYVRNITQSGAVQSHFIETSNNHTPGGNLHIHRCALTLKNHYYDRSPVP